MISAPDRRETLQLIEDAVAAGARRAQACAELGLSLRSLQRWQHCPEDRRPSAQRAEPANKLTPQERRRVLEVANQPEFASLPPQQIASRRNRNGSDCDRSPEFMAAQDPLAADHGQGPLLLLVHDQGRLQPEAGGQRGA